MTSLLELSGQAWTRHRHDGTALVDGALALAPGRDEGAFQALLPRGPDVDRLVLSPNPEPWPEGALLRVRVRARLGDAWSPWAPLGVYGRGERLPTSEVGPDPGAIEVLTDTAALPRPTRQVELRLELVRGPGGGPRLRRLFLAAWRHRDRAPGAEPAHRPAAWGREVEVPERSQKVEDPAIAGRICSPTSLAMVLARWGRELPTAEVARRVYDHGGAIYGNWSFNVALAAELGLVAAVARVAAFAPVEEEIAAGRPVVITHRHGPGEVQGGAVNGTDGHLIVIRGFTAEGDPIVNDPAADPHRGESIRRVYRRADLARSWLQNADGVCYLIRDSL